MIRTLVVTSTAVFWLLVAGASSAQVTENVVESEAANTTGIIFEGSKGTDLGRRVPNVSVVGSNATAPCMIPVGGGAAFQGIGVGITTAVEDVGCTIRQEATLLAQLSEVSDSIPPEASTAAACLDESMRKAILLSGGTCPNAARRQATARLTSIEFTGGRVEFPAGGS
jgi:hypothetical protein